MKGDGLCLRSHTWFENFCIFMLSPHNDFPGLDVVLMWGHCILIDTLVVIFVGDIAVCYGG